MRLSECNYLWSNCPGAIIRGQSSRGQLSRGQYSSGAIILGGNCPGAIIQGAIIQGPIVRGQFSLGAIVRTQEDFTNIWQGMWEIWETWKARSSRPQMFFKIGVLKNVAIFTGKNLCWSFFLIKLQTFRTATLSKRNFNTGVFL